MGAKTIKQKLEDRINNFKIKARLLFCSAVLMANLSSAKTYYVSPEGFPVKPYETWLNAARTIEDAVKAVGYFDENSEIVVTNGIYTLEKSIDIINLGSKLGKIKSVNGPEHTIIDGNDNVRGINMNFSHTVIEGFTISNCNIGKNDSPGSRGQDGGGVKMSYSGTIRNCIIRDCKASGMGGGVALINGGSIEHSVIAKNYAKWYHGGIYISSDNGFVRNSIIHDNTGRNGFLDGFYLYCCTQESVKGHGTITEDPGFVNVSINDYHLRIDSPCIEKGYDFGQVRIDGEGISRPLDGDNDGIPIIDIGPYEYLNPIADSDLDGSPDGDEAIAGTDLINPLDYFMIKYITVDEFPSISFKSVKGRVYSLQSKGHLNYEEGWQTKTNNIQGTGKNILVKDPILTKQRVYRIIVGLN